jgi:glycosyltransferase involved in cell wall biosynthesis
MMKRNNIEKLLWIGPYMDPLHMQIAIKKGYKQVAANTSQSYFLYGIEHNLKKEINVISAIRPPEYPKYGDLHIKRHVFEESKLLKGINVSFFNIKYLSHFFRYFSVLRETKKWAKDNKEKNVFVVVYSLHSPFLKAAILIKKIIPNAKIFVIVPDLPLNMDMSSKLQQVFKHLDWLIIKKMILKIDKFVLFTEQMAQYLKIPIYKWILIEGLINKDKLLNQRHVKKYKKRTILYMGSLKKSYNLELLVNAFSELNLPDVELHVYGRGESEGLLKLLSQKNKNFIFCNYVSSDIAFKIMQKATILVNPRSTSEDFTKYSFPSKTFEYMASGTPLITTKLPGIPFEYFNYTYCFEDETVEGFKNTLISVLTLSDKELNDKGKTAKMFILKNKNSIKQTNKMLKFLQVK